MKRIWVLLGLMLALGACNNQDGVIALDEQAAREERKVLQVQAEERARRASEMESDLAARHRFYEAVRGVYEGSVTTESGLFQIRLTLVPSLPSYRTERTRTFEEIASDLSNLHFNIQVVQWNAGNPLSAVGCRVEGVHPDIARGSIEIAAEACANVYRLRLARKGDPSSAPKESEEIAQRLIAGNGPGGHDIVGQMYPTTTAAVYQIAVTKVSP